MQLESYKYVESCSKVRTIKDEEKNVYVQTCFQSQKSEFQNFLKTVLENLVKMMYTKYSYSKAWRKAKEKTGSLFAINFKSKNINLLCTFFDGISFKSIHIIEKRRPAVRHTSEGLIIFVWNSFEIIDP